MSINYQAHRPVCALITGISGQDGAILAAKLYKNNITVIGLVRSLENVNLTKLEDLGISKNVRLVEISLVTAEDIEKVINIYHPKYIFNFASQSSVGYSYEIPFETLHFNVNSTLAILEAIRKTDITIRLIHASSSEVFGHPKNIICDELSEVNPENPYANSKAISHALINTYRDLYGLNVSIAIFFNHESIYRDERFVVKKLIHGLIRVKKGLQSDVQIGDQTISRDFGCAIEYMDAIYKMALLKESDNFIISSGKSTTIAEIIDYILIKIGLDRTKVKTDSAHFRKNDVQNIVGNNDKASKLLEWNYTKPFAEVLDGMINHELEKYVVIKSKKPPINSILNNNET